MTKIRKQLVEVARGDRPADLYIENGRILNVYSGEILSGLGIAVTAGHVAYVGPGRGMIGAATRRLDAEDRYLVPGYIDPHAHFDCFLSLRSLAASLLPLGTTTPVNDTLAMVARFGSGGLDYLRAAGAGLPLHVFYTVPASGWAPELEDLGYPAGRHLSDAELDALLADDMVLGTAEFLTWRRLISGDPQAFGRLELARARGKLREGHSPGAKADQLQALAAAGISDCHEAITADDALQRLRAGMYVILRH
ncbi:MAG: adenine deaminase, partial [Desulfuromonadales bacterium]|nr:adenine deaminase [Desulfuromonadales bacterium]